MPSGAGTFWCLQHAAGLPGQTEMNWNQKSTLQEENSGAVSDLALVAISKPRAVMEVHADPTAFRCEAFFVGSTVDAHRAAIDAAPHETLNSHWEFICGKSNQHSFIVILGCTQTSISPSSLLTISKEKRKEKKNSLFCKMVFAKTVCFKLDNDIVLA